MKPVKSTSSKLTALLAASAIAGIMSGSAAYAQAGNQASNNDGATQAGDSAPTKDATEKHSCKGKNSCKGKGGCKSGDNGCKGLNSCKGKGGCSTKKKG